VEPKKEKGKKHYCKKISSVEQLAFVVAICANKSFQLTQGLIAFLLIFLLVEVQCINQTIDCINLAQLKLNVRFCKLIG